jgi:hypothetical protein
LKDLKTGTWYLTSLNKSGACESLVMEITKYNLDSRGKKEIRLFDGGGGGCA